MNRTIPTHVDELWNTGPGAVLIPEPDSREAAQAYHGREARLVRREEQLLADRHAHTAWVLAWVVIIALAVAMIVTTTHDRWAGYAARQAQIERDYPLARAGK